MDILIAEDDIITRRALERNVREWGFDVVLARDGEEAWKAIKENCIRMAILDWTMPKMDGLEVCRRIRQENPERCEKYTYIILLTGRDLQEDVIAGLSAGADDYVTKPFDPLELKVRLQNGERIIRLEDSRLVLAVTDSLTKQWNRKGILERLEEEFARSRRQGTCLSTVMLDIDNLKVINDRHGHMIGDEVLVEVAARLKSSIRRYDELGRYGGDEFLIILPGCQLEKMEKIAERLRRAVGDKKVGTAAGPIRVSISLGLATLTDEAKASAKTLIERSDRALLTAKKEGRNRVELAAPGPGPAMRKR